MWHRTANIGTALKLAEELKVTGKANWFRGQTRNWPLLSSYVRKTPSEQKMAIERINSLYDWMHDIQALAKLRSDKNAVLAVAQHYGMATMLVDFSTEPRVAAFFAAHNPPSPEDGDDESCIICLNYEELIDVYESVKIVRPNMPEPRAIILNIPELWRIQSQHGVFLEYPYDTGFEQHTFGFDRIVFPTERDPNVLSQLMPVHDIYPTQKSDLEILLDQFFMLEKMAEGTRAINEIARSHNLATYHQDPVPDGIEAECFGPIGLPIHESWDSSRLTEWLTPAREEWQPISSAPSVEILYPDGSHLEKIQNIRDQIVELIIKTPKLRHGPVKWILHGIPSDSHQIIRAMELLWDGLRRWPYNINEIAEGLATIVEYGILVDQKPAARYQPQIAQELAEKCFGKLIEIEVGIEDSSYTRGYVSKELLRQAVRDDFFSFLTDQWRSQIKSIRHILQIAYNPRRTLIFDTLKSVFCTQFAPTQAVLRDEKSGKTRLYNLARTTTLGLP
ncbi:MAG: FRG domain-containing protein [Calditrichaeota bacterium]|nr:MAG: FRG domain-containing protein [Calditrichota bacterium]